MLSSALGLTSLDRWDHWSQHPSSLRGWQSKAGGARRGEQWKKPLLVPYSLSLLASSLPHDTGQREPVVCDRPVFMEHPAPEPCGGLTQSPGALLACKSSPGLQLPSSCWCAQASPPLRAVQEMRPFVPLAPGSAALYAGTALRAGVVPLFPPRHQAGRGSARAKSLPVSLPPRNAPGWPRQRQAPRQPSGAGSPASTALARPGPARQSPAGLRRGEPRDRRARPRPRLRAAGRGRAGASAGRDGGGVGHCGAGGGSAPSSSSRRGGAERRGEARRGAAGSSDPRSKKGSPGLRGRSPRCRSPAHCPPPEAVLAPAGWARCRA